MNMEEIWRDAIYITSKGEVYNYKGLYEASNYGNVRTVYRVINKNQVIEQKNLSYKLNRYGYYTVTLHKDRLCKYPQVAQIIASTFPDICGEWFENCQVDHINTIRTDNRAENLRLCTAKENRNNPLTLLHSSLAMKGEKHWGYGRFGSESPKSIDVDLYTLDGTLVKSFGSCAELAEYLELTRSAITRHLKRINKTLKRKYIAKIKESA